MVNRVDIEDYNPLIWDVDRKFFRYNVETLRDQISTLKSEPDEIFRYFILKICLIRELKSHDDDATFKEIMIAEEELITSTSVDLLFKCLKDTLLMILRIMKYHQCVLVELEHEQIVIGSQLNIMCTKHTQMSLMAVKASILFEYGGDNITSCLLLIADALKIDIEIEHCLFLKAKSLRYLRCLKRLRKVSFDETLEEEIGAVTYLYTQAKKLNLVSCYYMAECGEMLLEYSILCTKLQSSSNADKFTASSAEYCGMAQKAFVLYIENCPWDRRKLMLCGRGLMMLSELDIDNGLLAKQFLKEAMKMDITHPNINIIHAMGRYYELFELEFKRAKEYYTICNKNDFLPAELDLLRLSFRNQEENIEKRLHDLLDKYTQLDAQYMIKEQLASYLLIIRNDVSKAVNIIMEILETCDQNLKDHFSVLDLLHKNISLLDIAANAVRNEMRLADHLTHETRAQYTAFLDKLKRMNVVLTEVPEDKPCNLLTGVINWDTINSKQYVEKAAALKNAFAMKSDMVSRYMAEMLDLQSEYRCLSSVHRVKNASADNSAEMQNGKEEEEMQNGEKEEEEMKNWTEEEEEDSDDSNEFNSYHSRPRRNYPSSRTNLTSYLRNLDIHEDDSCEESDGLDCPDSGDSFSP